MILCHQLGYSILESSVEKFVIEVNWSLGSLFYNILYCRSGSVDWIVQEL